MTWASYLSDASTLEGAVREAAAEVLRQLGEPPDLVMVFVSEHHAQDYPEVPGALRVHFPEAVLIGCSGGGVVGGGREIENGAALSITAARLPGVRLHPFHIESEATDKLVESPARWLEQVELDAAEPIHFILLPEPFSCDARGLLASLDLAFPASSKIGGLASGAQHPGDNALFVQDEVFPDGAAVLAINGPLDMDTIVAQGCRPIGPPLFVTAAFRNRILELDGRKPTDVLSELYEELEVADRRLFRHSLFVGVVMNDGQREYEHGDFLIRNIVGLDGDTGMVAVGEIIERGQVVQFHLRDAEASARDLELLLHRYRDCGAEPEGALLFACQGRGEVLYGEPDHDSRMISRLLGPLAIGGFFCQGEIGPVNRRTFLHGYTSSIALFRPRRPSGSKD